MLYVKISVFYWFWCHIFSSVEVPFLYHTNVFRKVDLPCFSHFSHLMGFFSEKCIILPPLNDVCKRVYYISHSVDRWALVLSEPSVPVCGANYFHILWIHVISWAQNFMVLRWWTCTWTLEFVDFKSYIKYYFVSEWIFHWEIKFVDCPNFKIYENKCQTNKNDFTVSYAMDIKLTQVIHMKCKCARISRS